MVVLVASFDADAHGSACYDLVPGRCSAKKDALTMIGSRPALYEDRYAWFVLVSALDLMLTWIILHVGGREVNAVAAAILDRYDLPGLVVFKFSLVTVVIVLCEIIGRLNMRAGQRLASSAIAITCIPLLIAVLMLGRTLLLAPA
jgi:hypothetical protein